MFVSDSTSAFGAAVRGGTRGTITMTEAMATDGGMDAAREAALSEYRTKLLAHKEVDSQVRKRKRRSGS